MDQQHVVLSETPNVIEERSQDDEISNMVTELELYFKENATLGAPNVDAVQETVFDATSAAIIIVFEKSCINKKRSRKEFIESSSSQPPSAETTDANPNPNPNASSSTGSSSAITSSSSSSSPVGGGVQQRSKEAGKVKKPVMSRNAHDIIVGIEENAKYNASTNSMAIVTHKNIHMNVALPLHLVMNFSHVYLLLEQLVDDGGVSRVISVLAGAHPLISGMTLVSFTQLDAIKDHSCNLILKGCNADEEAAIAETGNIQLVVNLPTLMHYSNVRFLNENTFNNFGKPAVRRRR